MITVLHSSSVQIESDGQTPILTIYLNLRRSLSRYLGGIAVQRQLKASFSHAFEIDRHLGCQHEVVLCQVVSEYSYCLLSRPIITQSYLSCWLVL